MTAPSESTIEQVWARDASRCFRCARQLIRGQGDYSIHHRRPRGAGGSRDPVTNSPANLILLCGTGTTGCHGWVESHRASARADGLLVSRFADPREIPVMRWRTTRIYLTDDGQLINPGRVHRGRG